METQNDQVQVGLYNLLQYNRLWTTETSELR
jgi:hypothetical protein